MHWYMKASEPLPIIERQCKHNSKKVIRREIFEGYFITAVDLCSKCQNSLEFAENLEFIDKKIQSKSKLKTKSEIKKAITKRKKEIDSLQKEIKNQWNIQDTMKKVPKFLECYIALEVLHGELDKLYEQYIRKFCTV